MAGKRAFNIDSLAAAENASIKPGEQAASETSTERGEMLSYNSQVSNV